MINKLKSWLENTFLDFARRNHYLDEAEIFNAINDAKEDVWADTASRTDLDNVEYEIEEMGNSIEDHEDRIDSMEDDFEGVASAAETLSESLQNLAGQFKKSIDMLSVLLKAYKEKATKEEADKAIEDFLEYYDSIVDLGEKQEE